MTKLAEAVLFTAIAKPSHAPEYTVRTILADEWIEIGGVKLSWNDAAVAFEVHHDCGIQGAALKKIQQRGKR